MVTPNAAGREVYIYIVFSYIYAGRTLCAFNGSRPPTQNLVCVPHRQTHSVGSTALLVERRNTENLWTSSVSCFQVVERALPSSRPRLQRSSSETHGAKRNEALQRPHRNP